MKLEWDNDEAKIANELAMHTGMRAGEIQALTDAKESETSTQTFKAKKYTFAEIEKRGFDLDLCGYPEEEDVVLPPEETIKNYKERRESLEAKLDEKLALIMNLLEVK